MDGGLANVFHALNVGLHADVYFEYAIGGALRGRAARSAARAADGSACAERRPAWRVRGVFPPIESRATPATKWLQAAQLHPALSDPSHDEESLVDDHPRPRSEEIGALDTLGCDFQGEIDVSDV